MADRLKLAQGLRNLPASAREDLAGREQDIQRGKTVELLRRAGKEMYENPIINATLSAAPVTGEAMLANDIRNEWNQGNYGTAIGLGVLGAAPYGATIGKGLLAARALEKPIEELSSAALRKITGSANATPIGVMDEIQRMNLLPSATVWHGSPHTFDKFDLSKIGTGEGAQAYGHGLYLADRPAEAMKYQPRDIEFENKLMKRYEAAQNANDWTTAQVYEDFLAQKTPEDIAQTIGEYFSGKDLERAKKAFEIGKKEYGLQTAGGLYKVDLPDEQIAKMIDYYKPIAEQPEAYAAFQKYAHETQANPEMALKQLQEHTGAEAYGMWNNPEGVSQFLKEQGVPGIKYTEQKYLAKPNLTPDYNYVVFDENLPQILERNAIPVNK